MAMIVNKVCTGSRVSWIFTDPDETFSIESPLLPEFRKLHIFEIGWGHNCHKAADSFAKKMSFLIFLSFSVNSVNTHLTQS